MSAASPPLAGVLDRLRERLGAQLVAELELAAEPERCAQPEPPLPTAIRDALAAAGIDQLWSHQVEALTAARAGDNVLVTTPTASGKSLIFQLPVLEEVVAGRPGRALFLFPLKALGQDQRTRWQALVAAAGVDADLASCEIYDGDTPSATRARIRRRPPRVLITNPDMLHLGILPGSASWEEFLRELRWIVLDELHVYRGIFGCHFHHVLGRLRRLAAAAGGATGRPPSVIAASATASGAGEFAAALAGAPFREIDRSGAPRERRRFLLVRPLASPYTTAIELLAELVRGGQKTIVFTRARRITELLWRWLERREPDLVRRVRSYRAGFLPEERREIEARLFAGELDGVIATSALELGIDVGGLDACILVGYPGSVMATRQRSGRVGRSGRESVTVLVALPDALDQWVLDHPEQFVERASERLFVDPDNELVAAQHLVCAAAERPLDLAADAPLLERFAPVVGTLLRDGALVRGADGDRLLALARRPHRDVSLRGTGGSFAIVESESGRTVGTVDGARVFAECHPGAIYLHAGRQYAVASLELATSEVRVVRADVDWYTAALSEKETEVLEEFETLAADACAERSRDRGAAGELRGGWGRLRVTERVVGYERRRSQGLDVLDQHHLDLPPVVTQPHGFWLCPPAVAAAACEAAGHSLLGSLHALEHATIGLLPSLVLCDRNDLGGISLVGHPQLGAPGFFVHEAHAGGVGIARRALHRLPELLQRTVDLLAACGCENGCPACVQSPKCGNGNRPLDKGGALLLARAMLAAAAQVSPAPATSEREAPPPPRPAPARPPVAEEVVPPPARAERTSGATVLFDIETLRSADEVGGWGKAHRMGVAVAVALFLEEGRFEVYREAQVGDLVAALKAARLVVGYNSRRFDYAVLSGYTGEDYARTLPTLDLLESLHARLGFRVGLGHVAQETLGATKSADGLQSLEWVRAGQLEQVIEYCRRDVELLRDVYLFGRREGHVVVATRSGRVRVEVDW